MFSTLFAALLFSAAPAQADAATDLPTARFEVREPRLKTDRYTELARAFQKDDPLHELVARLNQSLRLPTTLGLRYAECGEANAYYDRDNREVLLCFELIEKLADDFAPQLDNDADLAEAVTSAHIFITLHEVGHALVDVLELPITGREEDAVDQLSAWLLIGEESGNAAVLDAAVSFSLASERYDLAENDFADLHSLDRQRYYNMVCWVIGSDPQAHAGLAHEAGLPDTRAATCAEEYQRLDRSWSKLLKGFTREDISAEAKK
jgi:hypothetical protein